MSDFRELCFTKTMRDVIYCLKVCALTDMSTKSFRQQIVLVITQLSNRSPENMIIKNKI